MGIFLQTLNSHDCISKNVDKDNLEFVKGNYFPCKINTNHMPSASLIHRVTPYCLACMHSPKRISFLIPDLFQCGMKVLQRQYTKTLLGAFHCSGARREQGASMNSVVHVRDLVAHIRDKAEFGSIH